jgi:NADPH-dependent 2,4-dienoyl-CoA reductase/sulfur reductase-like enzyme/rhodanese-related sulfurtransferase
MMSAQTQRKIVIVGGVAGGAAAAAKARRTDEHADIVMFERGPHVSFANCGLPYYVGGDIADRESLLLQTPESFWRRFRVRVHVRHEVLGIDRAAQQVKVRNLETGVVFLQPYDALVLSPGAGAIVPNLAGLPARNVFVVKTVPDSDAVRGWLDAQKPTRAVVVGAGFIGLETAEALHQRGLHVTVVELQPQVLPALDADMAEHVARRMRDRGVDLVLADGIAGFETDAAQTMTGVRLASGKVLPAGIVILSIGVRPELKLAVDAGLTIGAAGGIAVDERQRTSDPKIYAAGDAVEVVQRVTGQKVRMPLAGPASKQGRVAGANAAGGDLQFPGALGTAILGTMGISAGRTGLTEREARAQGFDVLVTHTHNLDHAGYYPGALMLHIKLVTDAKTGRLLGGQVVGENGVDKRLDVLATALQARMHVDELEELDLAYAPQFSSARDPVIMAGHVASNAMRNGLDVVTCPSLREQMAAGEAVQLLDVRTPGEFAAGHLDGALNLPLDDLRENLEGLDRAAHTVVYCKVGFRGYLAARILQQNGFADVKNLTGGMWVCGT